MTANPLLPSPETTLVIILGASEFPEAPGFEPNPAFANSAQGFEHYFLHVYRLPKDNLLNLFNKPESPSEPEKEIRNFLRTHTNARDIIMYFVGHGGFTATNRYHLFVRHSQVPGPESSKVEMESLARTIKGNAPLLRRIIILDSCFAGASNKEFSSAEAQVAVQQTINAFKERDVGRGIPTQGTSLLCSSSKDNPSVTFENATFTAFSGALLHILGTGDIHLQDNRLTLRSIYRLVNNFLFELYRDQVPRSELHSPDQSQGDIAEEIPFFPNLARRNGHLFVPLLSSPPPAVDPPQSSSPAMPLPPRTPKQFKDRHPRAVVILLSILLLSLILGSMKFFFFQTSSSHPNSTPHLSDYDKVVAAQGIQFGFDASHTHFNPKEQILNRENISHQLKELGSFFTGDKIFSSPVVSDGVVYIGSWDGFLYALDAKCNVHCKRLWSSRINTVGDNHVDSSPATVNGVVYIGSDNGRFYAFSTTCKSSSCDPLWSSLSVGGAFWSSPTVANGRVYAGSWNGTFYAFDATCRSPDCSTPDALLTVENTHMDASAVADGGVYVSSNNGKLYALDAACRSSCTPRWIATTGGSLSSPTIANKVVYVGSLDHKLYAFPENCSSDCKPLWTATTGGNVGSSPAVANGMVYVGSDDQRVYTFGIPSHNNA